MSAQEHAGGPDPHPDLPAYPTAPPELACASPSTLLRTFSSLTRRMAIAERARQTDHALDLRAQRDLVAGEITRRMEAGQR